MQPRPAPRPRTHVFIVDGTFSSTEPGMETHCGALWRMLTENGASARQSVAYHPGVQGIGLRGWWRAATGAGVNDAIRDGYGFLTSRWRPGDKILLFGYSRGAYAVRSLAGLIDQVGLLRRRHAVHRRVSRAFRHYEAGRTASARAFAHAFCHTEVPVDAIFAWDTVKALGLPLPGLAHVHPLAHEFHNHELSGHIRAGFHALAADENRRAFAPVMWDRAPGWDGRLEQMWFPGAHADVGGHVEDRADARPLSNLSMRWMLERAETCGLELPYGWRDRFPVAVDGPMLSADAGIGRLFLMRAARQARTSAGERASPAIAARMAAVPHYHPLAKGLCLPPGEADPGALPAPN
jgi:uncharacterized protein (DUF2235 family)